MSTKGRLWLLIIANIISSIGSGVTAFIIPFLTINLPHGERLYAYLYMGVGIVTLMITPFTGVIIDRFSRKKILVFCELFGAVLFSLILLIYYLYSGNSIISFICLFIFTMVSFIYSNFKIPTNIAFIQEIFSDEEYAKVNSAMEIQGQFATFISAGITAVLVNYINIWSILLFDIVTYLLALLIILVIPYTKRKSVDSEKETKINYKEDLKVAFQFIKKQKTLFVFLLCTLIPSIMVLVGNYINPVFVFKDLNLSADIQGYSSLIYAFSAMLGGMIAAYLSKKFGNYFSTFFTYSLYLIGIIWIVIQPILAVFLFARVFAGIGNTATRALRNNVMMLSIPNDIIGKVSSLMNSFSYVVQLLLVGFLSLVIENIGGRGAFVLVVTVMSVFLVILFIYGNRANQDFVKHGALKKYTEEKT